MKKIFVTLIAISLIISTGCSSFFSKVLAKDSDNIEKKHPIDIKVEKCIIECDYATACTAGCINNSDKDWENEINKYILKLKKIMTPQEYSVLQNSQKEWEEYRKAQELLDEKTIGTIMGSMYLVVMASNRITLLENRAKELEILYHYFSDK